MICQLQQSTIELRTKHMPFLSIAAESYRMKETKEWLKKDD
jgi:hypothetical protein